MKGSFYEPTEPEVAMERYLQGLGGGDLYSAQKNKVIMHLLKKETLSEKKVLDVGCGGGLWTAYFITQEALVTSCDIRMHLIDAAKLYLDKKGYDKQRVTFIHSDIIDLETKEKYDFIFCKDIIEHIDEDERFLRKMYKLLTLGGKIFISTQNAFSLNYAIESFIYRLRGNKEWKGWDPTHVRFYTPYSLKEKLQNAGFKPIRWFSIYHFPYKIIFKVVTKLITGREKKCAHLIFHFLDRWAEIFPFNKTGWNLGVIAEKIEEK